MCKLFFTSLFVVGGLLLSPRTVYSQTHKGIGFQAVITLPSGDRPTKVGLTVNAMILSPNDCVLREEQFTNVNISNGYLYIPIGTGTATGDDPGLNLKQVMDNTSTITQGPSKLSGLVCFGTNGNVNSSVTSYNPASGDGRRKLRLSVTIDNVPLVVDFNMRSMAYAINAETSDDAKKLNGKADSSFIQTSTNVTQMAVENLFSSPSLSPIINGTYNAPTATTLSSTLPLNKGGTNLSSIGTANQILGVDASGNGLEYKTLTAGSNITLTQGANSITINATGGLVAETDPSVQAFAKNAVSTGLSVNGSNQLALNFGTTTGTAAEGNDSRITGAFQAGTSLSGDLTGTLVSPTVAKLQNNLVASGIPTDGLLTWNSTLTRWEAVNPPTCTAAQVLIWSSVMDSFACNAITGIPAANISGLSAAFSTVASSGSYNDLSNRPILGSLAAKNSVDLSSTDATGILAAERFPAMTGDVTSTAGSLTNSIANNAVTNAKFRQGVPRSVVGVTGNAAANVSDIQGTANQVLRVDSAGTSLAFGALNLTSSAAVNGALSVNNGGTGLTATPTNGMIPIGNGVGYALANLTAGSNVTITNAAGAVTIGASVPYGSWPLNCPTGYVSVPALPGYTAEGFCVAKYEMKNVGGIATSQAALTPWGGITRGTDATTAGSAWKACKDLGTGYNLISNAQWQTIARNIADTARNWGTSENGVNATSAYGTGALSNGHSDNSPANSLAANADDTMACDGTGQTCSDTNWSSQRRTFYLSNGSVIWDFAGNLAEWTRDNVNAAQGANDYLSTSNLNDSRQNNFGNDQFCNSPSSSPYCGFGYGVTSYAGGVMHRGGMLSEGTMAGVFSVALNLGTGNNPSVVGFRCVYQP